jgi:MFS family permease
MLAQFFFLALYMQNILHYSPLQTGVRFLPSTVVIIIMGPLAGRLTDRIGPRIPMALGLLTVALALFIQSHLTIHSGYGLLLPGFILMGLGMGLTMSPMSTAAMNSVDRTKAGVASGVLSMNRMVGGTFGVAVTGAMLTAIGKSKINQGLPHLPAASRSALANALGAGGAPGHGSAHVVAVVRDAFVSALGVGLTIGAAVTLVGAVVAFTLVQPLTHAHRTAGAEHDAAAAADAEAAAEAGAEAELTLV